MMAFTYFCERPFDPAFNMETVDTRRKENCELKRF